METLISQFTFFSSDQTLQDKIFDPFTTEDLMKLFEIESYKAWVAVELEQEKEVEEAEVTMQQTEDDHFDWVMESAIEEFRFFEEELERMDSNSFIEAIASSKVHPS